jgi:hypothetical protein
VLEKVSPEMMRKKPSVLMASRSYFFYMLYLTVNKTEKEKKRCYKLSEQIKEDTPTTAG